MTLKWFRVSRASRWMYAVGVGLAAWLVALHPAAAQDLKQTTALKFVPADVAFYSSSLRVKEQFDIFVHSKAFEKLTQIPAIQFGLSMAKMQWDNAPNPQVQMLKQALQQPANQQLVAMLQDAVSHEIFMAGDAGIADTLMLFNQINAAVNTSRIEAEASGQDLGAVMIKRMLEIVNNQGDRFKVPDVLIGFKIADTNAAKAQLARLEGLANMLAQQNPELGRRFTKQQLAGGEYLSLSLDGSMVPWDQIPLHVAGDAQESLQQLVNKLKSLTLNISLGLRDGYLLLSIGDNTDHLKALGQGSLLADREELKPLFSAGNKPYTGVSYTSADFMQRIGSGEQQFNDLAQMAEQLLPMAPVPPNLQREMIADIRSMVDDLKKMVPKPGAAMRYSYTTPRGYECMSYKWGEFKGIDASKNLSILDHVGGDPLIFVAGRAKRSPEDYDVTMKWIKRACYYAEQLAIGGLNNEQRQAYEALRTDILPRLERMEKTTHDQLAPAFADGQAALVIDAKSTNTQWFTMLPPSDKPLPMLEIGLVQGITGPDPVIRAFQEYGAAAQEILNSLHNASAGQFKNVLPEIPQITIPSPKTKEFPAGVVYYYPLPPESLVSKDFAPNAGLGHQFMVVSMMPKFTVRLLDEHSVIAAGPLANVNRPLAGAAYCNFAGFIDAITPWIDYGVNLAGGQVSTAAQPNIGVAAVVGQVKQVLEVLQCLRGVASVTYAEGPAMVTHTEWHFEDLK